ncbi:MAG: serine/threonine protein kinase, partial [bacterium]|nr:serine/threonine protein kinase [bacterium]
MIRDNYPKREGDILNGKWGYRIIDELSSSGKYAQLYKVSPITKPSDTCLAKFFKISDIREYPRNQEGLLGTEDQRAFKRFKKEPKFLKKFNHSNIVGYIDEYSKMESGDSNQCFYVMEYLSGRSLYRHVEQHAIPGDPIKIAIGVASALVELHRKKVVHRDIHLGNIFLSNGSPKLIDFGCAVGGGITRPYPYYDGKLTRLAGEFHRAPESINPTEATPKSDIFSFGITLLELLNTKIPSPYERENRKLWIDRSLNKLSRSQPRFEILIRQMLRPDPSERLSSTEVLRYLRQDRSILPWIILGGAAVATTAAILWSTKSEKKKKKLTSSKSARPIKKRIRAVFLDIDNTIAHKTKFSENFITLPPGDSYISNRTLKLL